MLKKPTIKINLLKILSVIFFFIMLISSTNTKQASINGLNLWLYTIVPTLLPYFIATNIIIYFNAFSSTAKLFHPALRKIFKCSKNGVFPIVCGFICGFPLGIKTINDLLQTKKITATEANYLSIFCNNLSMAFYINIVILNLFNPNYIISTHKYGKLFVFLLFILPYLSSVITSKIYLFNHKSDIINLCKQADVDIKKQATSIQKSNNVSMNFLGYCISNALESILKIGGYVILFSIISNLSVKYLQLKGLASDLCFPILEISNIEASINGHSLYLKILMGITLCTFGGFSALFQSLAMITSKEISKRNYVKYRIINTFVALCLAVILCCIMKLSIS